MKKLINNYNDGSYNEKRYFSHCAKVLFINK